MIDKDRLSATVDADLLEAGRAAVAAGQARSLSAWVNDALARQVEHDRRMRALAEFFAAYESEHGEITAVEMDVARRELAQRAVVVRASGKPTRRRPGGA